MAPSSGQRRDDKPGVDQHLARTVRTEPCHVIQTFIYLFINIFVLFIQGQFTLINTAVITQI